MGIIRNALRKLLDHELGVLGGDLDAAEGKLRDHEVKLQALAVRFERLQNRVGMRLTRAERGNGRDAADDELLRNLRARGGSQDDFEGWH